MSLKIIPNDLFFTLVETEIRGGRSLEIKVKGSSMHPSLKDDLHRVVLSPLRGTPLRTGMVALFVYNGKHLLHRLVAAGEDMLAFQGDNLPYRRECVSREDVIAFAEYIITPRGRVIDCKTAGYRMRSRTLILMNKLIVFPARKVKAVCSGILRKRPTPGATN